MADALDYYADPLAPREQDQAPTPKVGTGEDVAKGFAGGVGRGTAGLAGLPNMAAEYGARGIDAATRWVGGKLGVDVAPRQDQDPSAHAKAVTEAIESSTGKFYEPQTTAGQYASTFGEFLPGAFVPGLGPAGVTAKVVSAAVPAVTSETAGQLTKGTALEPWARLAGGVGGGIAGGKLVTPTAPVSEIRREAVRTLDEAGIPMTAGQRTGSKPIQWAEAAAADMPLSAGRAAELNRRTASAFDRAVTEQVFDRPQLAARGVPENVNLPDPRVVRAGRQSLEDEYTRLSANQLRSDPQLVQDLYAAEANYARNALPTGRSANVEQLRDDIVARLVANQGTMPGDVYQATRSRLGTLARASGNDPYQANALRDMRRALDDAMQRGLPPAEAEAWALNNARWGRMRQTEGAVSRAGENLSPTGVAQSARTGRAGQFAAQDTELDQLAKAGSLVLKPLPQSGTAPRSMFSNMGQMVTGGGASGGGLGFLAGGPPGAAAGAGLGALAGAAATVAPPILARATLSAPVQRYLANQLAPQTPRDILAQTLVQQAYTQPEGIKRNKAEREEFLKRRREQYGY